jgi:hypothetical protein
MSDMKCPHCTIHFYAEWQIEKIRDHRGNYGSGEWLSRTTRCPKCGKPIIVVENPPNKFSLQVYPIGANRGPVPKEVPKDIATDYTEACNVLPISAKASAALARRCLQHMLHQNGYKDRDLATEIGLLLNEADPKKALSLTTRQTVDAIRNFGNFSAHPINDQTTLQIIDVEPHEAEQCLETIEELFDHFYVGPAIAKAKKEALDTKLAAAGKPPSKG